MVQDAGKAGSSAKAGDEEPEARKQHLPRIFTTELRSMMYGFGDALAPRADSVHLMEEIVLMYIEAVVCKTTEVAQSYRRERPDVCDIMFVIRKDRRKLKRVRYLLEMKAEIQKATRVDAEKMAKGAPQ